MIFATLIGSDEKAGSFATRLLLYLVENPDAGGHHHRFLSRSSGLWCEQWKARRASCDDVGPRRPRQPSLQPTRPQCSPARQPAPFLPTPLSSLPIDSDPPQVTSVPGCKSERLQWGGGISDFWKSDNLTTGGRATWQVGLGGQVVTREDQRPKVQVCPSQIPLVPRQVDNQQCIQQKQHIALTKAVYLRLIFWLMELE